MNKMGVTVAQLSLATLMVGASVLGGCSTSTTASMSTTPVSQQGDRGAGTPGTVTLSWIAPTENTNGTPLTDLAGYHIRYGTDPGELTRSIDLSTTSTTAYEISGLSTGTYYFAISAYTAMGIESVDSAVGYKTI